MNELIASASDGNSRPERADANVVSGLVFLDDHQREHRHRKLIESLVRSWPIGVGILLAICAPVLNDLLTPVKPWGMWLVFPFVSLAARPELQLGGELKDWVPQIMLYLQFPLEGYLAKKFLKGRVTLRGVTGQILLFHFLGLAQLLLVCTALGSGVLH